MIKKGILFAIVVVLIVLLITWIVYGNSTLETCTISVSSKDLPTEFDAFRIAHISDLHNAEFGKDNRKLVSLLETTEADIIVITGDIVDSRRTNIEKAIRFAAKAAEIAPTYYVNGNHESRLSNADYSRLTARLKESGVTVLENQTKDITIGNETITLIGINDPNFNMEFVDDTVEQNVAHQLMKTIPQNNNYKVLLAHRPEYFDVYAEKVDLVLSGHAHGGQFIIPFVGGLLAPGQGLLPKYYNGLYERGTTGMIVSRGIGNSLFPFRINNKPTIVVAELLTLDDE